jgi:hypothetical protein
MEFSNSTTEDGIVQEIDRLCGSNSTNYTLKAKTARVNQALDRFFYLALRFDNNWTFDDLNQTDLPIGSCNLISGQQDYAFTSEFLMIRGVFAKDSNGVFYELEEETTPQNTLLVPSGNSGQPTKYRLIGNSILLDFIPNYNSTLGLKVHFARNKSAFVSTDTTKEPGIPSIFHPWIAQYAAIPYLIQNRLPQKNDIAVLVQQGEEAIKTYMAQRGKTVRRIQVKQESNK